MCGIFGYVGEEGRRAGVLLDGLKRLEYRGYDSAGAALKDFDNIVVYKKAKGRIENVERKLPFDTVCYAGVFHTRWATHGKPSDRNAHPHTDCDRKIYVVHNGIIENYKELREKLLAGGHAFSSDTDSEVLAHLIGQALKNGAGTLENAVNGTLRLVQGTYALLVLHEDRDEIVAARQSSPLILGIGDREHFAASDPSALLPFTREVVYLNDGERVVFGADTFRVFTADTPRVDRSSHVLEWDLEQASKQGYPHFMLKEIFEEPEAVENAVRGRLVSAEGTAKLGGLEAVEDTLRTLKRMVITACGTAFYAGLVGEYMLEEYGGVSTEVECASELRYRKPVFGADTALLAISQSGETADTLAAVKEAKRKGLLTLGIVNVVGSTIARESDAGMYNHAGPEIAVASTKAFVSQYAVLVLLTLFLGRQRNMSLVMGKRIASELEKIPSHMRAVLKGNDVIKKIACTYAQYDNFLFLGRKYNLPIALEGALKLKEISYVHAEGYSAGEMKHGPIALIDPKFPSVFIAPTDSVYEKVISNMEEVKARGGRIIAIATKGNKKVAEIANDVIYIPKTLEVLTPLLAVMPLHLFAYHVAVARGCDVDKPRNLAKSVTVE